ncbi:MAG TPA: flagellar biosynthesis protein FliQ [Candidatus Rifleibacterium sp.]|nr:flagellar biosynthesis protein FliQ [Candidatus Rifleibacterium sp.]HPT46936.1 flagellar biosynthesis protein FliQ [Candidatus Rifleibacterium sp.]
MTEYTLVELFKQTFFLCLLLSSPILLLGMVLGVVISIFQTATSIQEQSLSFVPKLLITGLALIWLAPWMLSRLLQFTTQLLGQLQTFAR